jgi:hypothetical protein
MSRHAVILPFLALMTLYIGCGPTEKWIDVDNEPSGQQFRTRYVTSAKSVKIHSESRGIRIYIQLPDSISRVNRAKLGVQVKKFDFGKFMQNNYDEWLGQISLQTKESTPECQGSPPHTLELNRPQLGDVVVAIGHNSLGQLYISVNHKRAENTGKSGSKDPQFKMSLISIRVKPSGDKGRCVTEWKEDAAISEIVNEMLDMRDNFAQSMEDVQLGDVYRIGNRLKRQESVAPDTTNDLKGSF